MSGSNILIVEDELLIARQLKKKLMRLGYSVTGIVSSGEEAIQEVEDKQPDLVLMDIVIKGDMDGIETAEIIQRDFHKPVIYLTAYADDETIERAEVSAAYGYIVKPFQDREVHAMIKLALNRHRRDESLLGTASVVENLGQAIRLTATRGAWPHTSTRRLGSEHGLCPGSILGGPARSAYQDCRERLQQGDSAKAVRR